MTRARLKSFALALGFTSHHAPREMHRGSLCIENRPCFEYFSTKQLKYLLMKQDATE